MFMPHGHIVSSRLRRTDSTPILSRMLFQAGSLLLVIISVYLLKRIHIFSDKSYKVVQGLVFNLTLPCAIVMSFATNKHPMNLLWLVVFGLFACMIPLFIVYFGSRGDEPRYRAYQMLNASGLNIGAFCLPVVQTFMGPSAGLPVIMLDIGNAIIATAASLTITRSLLHLGSPTKNLPMSLRIKNIALLIHIVRLLHAHAGIHVRRLDRTAMDRHTDHAVRQRQRVRSNGHDRLDDGNSRQSQRPFGIGQSHRMAVPVQHHHRAVRMVPSAVRRTRPRNRGAGRVRAGDDLLHEIH